MSHQVAGSPDGGYPICPVVRCHVAPCGEHDELGSLGRLDYVEVAGPSAVAVRYESAAEFWAAVMPPRCRCDDPPGRGGCTCPSEIEIVVPLPDRDLPLLGMPPGCWRWRDRWRLNPEQRLPNGHLTATMERYVPQRHPSDLDLLWYYVADDDDVWGRRRDGTIDRRDAAPQVDGLRGRPDARKGRTRAEPVVRVQVVSAEATVPDVVSMGAVDVYQWLSTWRQHLARHGMGGWRAGYGAQARVSYVAFVRREVAPWMDKRNAGYPDDYDPFSNDADRETMCSLPRMWDGPDPDDPTPQDQHRHDYMAACEQEWRIEPPPDGRWPKVWRLDLRAAFPWAMTHPMPGRLRGWHPGGMTRHRLDRELASGMCVVATVRCGEDVVRLTTPDLAACWGEIDEVLAASLHEPTDVWGRWADWVCSIEPAKDTVERKGHKRLRNSAWGALMQRSYEWGPAPGAAAWAERVGESPAVGDEYVMAYPEYCGVAEWFGPRLGWYGRDRARPGGWRYPAVSAHVVAYVRRRMDLLIERVEAKNSGALLGVLTDAVFIEARDDVTMPQTDDLSPGRPGFPVATPLHDVVIEGSRITARGEQLTRHGRHAGDPDYRAWMDPRIPPGMCAWREHG